MPPLRPEALTWTALLGQWMDVARAALALPGDEAGDNWRASVVNTITLQSVTFALAELGDLPEAERPLGLDKAELLINAANRELRQTWGSLDVPDALQEILADARAALAAAARSCPTELIWPGPGPMTMPAIDSPEPMGTLVVMAPGTIVMPGEPVAWWSDRPGLRIDGCRPIPTAAPRQVYRQIDDDGVITGDVMAPIETSLLPGLPLLVPLFQDGASVGHFTMDPDDWLARQRRSMGDELIPVSDG